MARKDISPVKRLGNEERAQANFVELYTTIAAHEAAWSTYAPTATASSGSLTLATAEGAYTTIGKTVAFRAEVHITTNGTGGTGVVLSLPATANHATQIAAVDRANGIGLMCLIQDTRAIVYKPDGTYPGVDGSIISIGGVYEKQ